MSANTVAQDEFTVVTPVRVTAFVSKMRTGVLHAATFLGAKSLPNLKKMLKRISEDLMWGGHVVLRHILNPVVEMVDSGEMHYVSDKQKEIAERRLNDLKTRYSGVLSDTSGLGLKMSEFMGFDELRDLPVIYTDMCRVAIKSILSRPEILQYVVAEIDRVVKRQHFTVNGIAPAEYTHKLPGEGAIKVVIPRKYQLSTKNPELDAWQWFADLYIHYAESTLMYVKNREESDDAFFRYAVFTIYRDQVIFNDPNAVYRWLVKLSSSMDVRGWYTKVCAYEDRTGTCRAINFLNALSCRYRHTLDDIVDYSLEFKVVYNGKERLVRLFNRNHPFNRVNKFLYLTQLFAERDDDDFDCVWWALKSTSEVVVTKNGEEGDYTMSGMSLILMGLTGIKYRFKVEGTSREARIQELVDDINGVTAVVEHMEESVRLGFPVMHTHSISLEPVEAVGSLTLDLGDGICVSGFLSE